MYVIGGGIRLSFILGVGEGRNRLAFCVEGAGARAAEEEKVTELQEEEEEEEEGQCWHGGPPGG